MTLPRERQRIAAAWADYLARIVPAEAPQVQIHECRNAFYAGAVAAINLEQKYRRAQNLQARIDLTTELIEFGEEAERIAARARAQGDHR